RSRERMSAVLSQLEREFTDMVARIRKLEVIPVPSAAKLLKKTPYWVTQNLPVIIESRKSHSVRLVDIEEFQARRTVWPTKKERKTRRTVWPSVNGKKAA